MNPGPVRGAGVWQLAWPSMAMFALHALVGLVDFLFVSSLGTTAVAAVGASLQIHFLVFALLSSVTAGAVAVVARESGAGSWDEVGRVARSAVLLAALLAFGMMAAIPATHSIVSLLGVEDPVAQLGGACLAILLWCNVPFAVGLAVSFALRGAGDVRTPLLVGFATNALNVAADWVLIFGHLGAPALGATGSAVASGLAFTTGALVSLLLWWRGILVLRRGPWRDALDPARARRLLRVGVPTALEQSAFNGGLLLFLGIVADFGTEALAAYLIGVRILSICFIPGLGFATAASTLVGQHLGAQEPQLAARAGWRAMRGAIAVMGSVGLTIVLCARPLASWFGAAGASTVALAMVFIHILGAAQPLMAIEFAVAGGLRGAGDTRFPLVAILSGLFGARLGAAYLIARPLFGTVTAVWLCLLADYSVKALMLTLRFHSGRWKTTQV